MEILSRGEMQSSNGDRKGPRRQLISAADCVTARVWQVMDFVLIKFAITWILEMSRLVGIRELGWSVSPLPTGALRPSYSRVRTSKVKYVPSQVSSLQKTLFVSTPEKIFNNNHKHEVIPNVPIKRNCYPTSGFSLTSLGPSPPKFIRPQQNQRLKI